MDLLPYLLIAATGLLAGTLSGISGGGSNMLMLPAFILVGLPPQVAVATSKMNGLGTSIGGLSVFAKEGLVRKDILKVMAPIAIIIGIVTPFVFSAINSDVFQGILGIILVALIPTLFLKKKLAAQPSRKHKIAGYSVYTGILGLQALFGAGVGTLAMFVMPLLLGTSKLEANATKRAVTAFLGPITFAALLISGYVNLAFGAVGMAAIIIGARFGSKLAITKGEQFVGAFTAVMIGIAGISLIIDAIK